MTCWPPALPEVFRRVGVFVGGCDLDALTAVAMADHSPGSAADPLELAAGLLDVSLVTVTEGADGEPRVGMLETIRDMPSSSSGGPVSWTRPGAGTPSTTQPSQSEPGAAGRSGASGGAGPAGGRA